MPPQIDNSTGLDLSPDDVQVLERIFARYKRVFLIREFTAGLSGSRVVEARPIKPDGTPELPAVVKLASVSMIQQEWRAYQKHIRNRLPHIAGVSGRPTLLPTGAWGGLRYPSIGGSSYEITSLREFCRLPDVSVERLQVVLERLLQIMDNIWCFNRVAPSFNFHSSYDRVLPPLLLVQAGVAPGAAPTPVNPRNLLAQPLRPGDPVALAGFAVQKVDPARRTITLRAPGSRADAPAGRVRMRLPADAPIPDFQARQIVDLPAGVVLETRASRLQAEAGSLGIAGDLAEARIELAPGAWLPNPLVELPRLLDQPRGVNLATIHGDFNLENILVDPQIGDTSLIDFAEARQDHVLHDLLHLEAEIITHILPGLARQHQLDPARALAELSWRLHRTLADPAREQGPHEPAELRKPWAMLSAIRRAARRYLFSPDDLGEYYQGLALYLLGALRYRSLGQPNGDQLPKQITFWAAALACLWLAHPGTDAPPALAALLERPIASGAGGQTGAPGAPVPEPADGPRVAALPIDRIPPIGPLPAGSRVPLERNPRFIGRLAELRGLALRLSQAAPAGSSVPSAVAISGMGGLGKTQLASEFAHRYGRFFPGGVFWIACADPAAIPAEVAACGDRAALRLRPSFHELPLEQQLQLVLDEWRKPVARLLIFDNCEAPELIERWLPAGGCRALITSRRAGWAGELGQPTLELDVLRRGESIALLRAHHPDTDSAQLDAIAEELGDLPLALHLAGSYLARFRHTVDATSYLASLRAASPLHHQSLQTGALLPTEHDPHVARTFALSYDQLAGDEPAAALARGLIQAAACLAPGVLIPEPLAWQALSAKPGAPATLALAGPELGRATNQLVELGLARAEAGQTLWFHRLVIAFTRERMGDRLEHVRARVEQALRAEAERLNMRHEPAALRDWQAHLRFVADAALQRGDEPAAQTCYALGEHLYQVGDYHGARVYHQHALAIRQAATEPDQLAIARSLAQIGKALLFYGNMAEARPHLEQALAIQLLMLGDHTDTATTLNHLGFLLQSQGQLSAAHSCHIRALRMRRGVLGPEHPAVVESMCNLAFIEYQQGSLESARALLEEALELQRKATGEHHPETARVLTNLGQLLLAQNQLGAADRLFQQALAIQERELGAEHPETARTMYGLGDVRRMRGDRASARAYYEQTLAVFRTSHGADHARTKRVAELLELLNSSGPAS
jgi:tetratricopeptide (TPR) repeat protein